MNKKNISINLVLLFMLNLLLMAPLSAKEVKIYCPDVASIIAHEGSSGWSYSATTKGDVALPMVSEGTTPQKADFVTTEDALAGFAWLGHSGGCAYAYVKGIMQYDSVWLYYKFPSTYKNCVWNSTGCARTQSTCWTKCDDGK